MGPTRERSTRRAARAWLGVLVLPALVVVLGVSLSMSTAHRVALADRSGALERELAAQIGRIDASVERLASLVGGAAAHFSEVDHDPAGITDASLQDYLDAIGSRVAPAGPEHDLVYINRLYRDDIAAHVERRRASVPDFAVLDGPNRVYPAIAWARSGPLTELGTRMDANTEVSTALAQSQEHGRVVLSVPVPADGGTAEVIHIVGPVTDADGGPLGWVGTIVDVDDLVIVHGPTTTQLRVTDNRMVVHGEPPIGGLQRTGRVEVLNRTWTVTAAAPTPLFDIPILIAGLSLTVLGAGVASWGQRALRRLASDVDDVKRSRDHYASFLEGMVATIDLGIIACDADGQTTVMNEAARHMVGQDHPAGHTDDVVLLDWDGVPYPPKDLPLPRALRGASSRAEEIRLQVAGECRTHLAHAQPIRDSSDAITGAVMVVHDITDRKAAEAHMTHLAMRDHLTGLANRRQLAEDLTVALAAQRRGGPAVTLLFMDLDRFKQVNDTLGHHRGDQMLIDIAGRLSVLAHAGDVAARMGGDEFVLLCPHQPSAPAAHWLAREVSIALAPALVIDADSEVRAGVSIGVVRPDDAATVEDVLRHADLAMYEAKRESDASIRVYEPSLGDRASAHFATESALRRAITDRTLNVTYQPIIDVRRAAVVGAEALVRWERDGHVQLPASFLPLAEETGLITDIDLLVLDKACEALAALPGTARINVNLSARAAALPDLVVRVRGILENHGLHPDRLCLELTESTLISASTSLDRSLAELQATGVTLALDDFGTGYASLNYLRRFPVEVVKIDQSFVQDLLSSEDDREIVASTVQLASKLGLRTVAEGVETAAQAAILSELGCEKLQGYLFSRPTTLAAALAAPVPRLDLDVVEIG